MTPNLFRLEDTRAWLRYAAEDLQVAERVLANAPPFVRHALFHSQQAAEKALKAFLTWHDHPFRKTHDLKVLGKLCAVWIPHSKKLGQKQENSPSMHPASGIPASLKNPHWKKHRPCSSWRPRFTRGSESGFR